MVHHALQWLSSAAPSSGVYDAEDIASFKEFYDSSSGKSETDSSPLYRGLVLDTEVFDTLLAGRKVNLKRPYTSIESWSANPDVALFFALKSLGPRSQMRRMAVVLSRPRPRKGSVVMDFVHDDLKDIIDRWWKRYYGTNSEKADFFRLVDAESEVVTDIQCKSCSLSDVELVYGSPRRKTLHLLRTHGADMSKSERNSMSLVVFKRKNKAEAVQISHHDRVKQAASATSWRRKPKRRFCTDWSTLAAA